MPRTGRASRRPRPKGLPDLRSVPILPFMLNVVSIFIGVVALVLAVLAFFPLLGWANWFIIPLAVVGAGLGAISSKTSAYLVTSFEPQLLHEAATLECE